MHNLIIYAIPTFINLGTVVVFSDFLKKIKEYYQCIKLKKCNSPPSLLFSK